MATALRNERERTELEDDGGLSGSALEMPGGLGGGGGAQPATQKPSGGGVLRMLRGFFKKKAS